jgi:hypothetical protein
MEAKLAKAAAAKTAPAPAPAKAESAAPEAPKARSFTRAGGKFVLRKLNLSPEPAKAHFERTGDFALRKFDFSAEKAGPDRY